MLTGDTRIGVRGDFKIGLNETAIGLALPTALAEISGEAYGTVKRRLRGAASKIIAGSLA